MSFETGDRLGVYEIVSLLGAGGMGQVYRARDTKLGRDVAIKVLSPAMAMDADRLLRFEREAQLLASLNHPNIGAIYGVEEAPGIVALILELVAGETLAARLTPGSGLPIPEALAIARQIADALDAAHERGIVHRDLKPANIIVTPQGVVKVLDFGLARVDDRSPSLSAERSLTHSPTMMAPTMNGMLLGTAPYMSPEQARGRVVDKRTDIWAFGCVLYEMLTGCRTFPGDTTADSIAAILGREPDWLLLSATAPARIVGVIKRCLDKEPKSRLRDIADIRTELEDRPAIADVAEAPAVTSSQRRREYVAWAVAVVSLFTLGAVLAFRAAGSKIAAPPVARTSIVLPNDVRLSSPDTAYPLALTRDGGRLAFLGERDGRSELYIRDLSTLESKVVPGAEGAMHPFFSPDGQWIGFFAGGALQKVSVAGGTPLRICNVSAASVGADWGTDDTIVFALRRSGLWTVSAAGGDPQALKGSEPAAWPQILPDGKTVLFGTGAGVNISAIATMPLAGGERHIVGRTNESPVKGPAALGTGDVAQPRFVPPGYLMYGQSSGSVRAVPFDLASRTLNGSAVSMVDGVERGRAGGGVYFAVSETGLMIYAATGDRHQLVWVDRTGTASPISGDRLAFRHPRLSPDGKRIVVAINNETRRSDIWTYDADTGGKRRLTAEHHNLRPLWSIDGTSVSFNSAGSLVDLEAGGSGRRDVLVMSDGAARYPSSWSPDGRFLLIDLDDGKGRQQALFTRGETGKPLTKLFSGLRGQFSPDGRWIAFSSAESGREEIYVRSFPGLGGNVAISTDGGLEPCWARDGRELFFRQGDAVMAVAIDTSRGFRAEKPRRLFAGQYSGAGREMGFDVSPDGRRFVMVKSDEASTLRQLTVVQNWLEEVKARLPRAR